jgi:hypothetical protein
VSRPNLRIMLVRAPKRPLFEFDPLTLKKSPL